MKEEFEALKAVTGRLEHVKIPYMLTGSMAANFYVVPRMTRDIDIVIRLAEQDAEKILAVFNVPKLHLG